MGPLSQLRYEHAAFTVWGKRRLQRASPIEKRKRGGRGVGFRDAEAAEYAPGKCRRQVYSTRRGVIPLDVMTNLLHQFWGTDGKLSTSIFFVLFVLISVRSIRGLKVLAEEANIGLCESRLLLQARGFMVNDDHHLLRIWLEIVAEYRKGDLGSLGKSIPQWMIPWLALGFASKEPESSPKF